MNTKYKDELIQAVEDGKLYNIWYTAIPSKDNIDTYFYTVESEFINDKSQAFVVIDKKNE
jgi:hypothetical protein